MLAVPSQPGTMQAFRCVPLTARPLLYSLQAHYPWSPLVNEESRNVGFRNARALDFGVPDRAVGSDLQQRDEVAAGILDEIVGRARLQRGDRNRRILRGRDEHHRRCA